MSERNVRDELVKHVGERRVAYGNVQHGRSYLETPELVVTFDSHAAYLDALPDLDFKYDAGYGGQEIYGVVVFEDGTWLERGEYDGSEWWEHKVCPTRDEVLGDAARKHF